MRKGKTWMPAVGVVVAGVLVAGCGVKTVDSNGAPGAANTQTGCMKAAGLTLNPRDSDLLEVARDGVKGRVEIYTLLSASSAKDLGKSLSASGTGSAIGRQVVIYKGDNAGALKDTIEGCLRRYDPPAVSNA